MSILINLLQVLFIFIAYLRPIEEFRHTPIVPIPEKDIKEYQKKIEDKNRVGIFFEVKKQTVYYYCKITYNLSRCWSVLNILI